MSDAHTAPRSSEATPPASEPPALSVDGTVATITLRRPAQANRLSSGDVLKLGELIAQVNRIDEVRVLMLRASGKYFCSGYDIGSLGGEPVDFGAMVDAMEQARAVTVAVLQGGVYGGATDLALSCDFRIGAQGIDMFMPAARLGLHYYRSGLERYVSRLGLNNAKLLFLTAQRCDAQQMRQMGYLTHLVEPAALDEEADRLAQTIAALAPIPLLAMKRNLNHIARGTLDAQALAADIQRSMDSEDLKEGQAAFAERRAPKFSGR